MDFVFAPILEFVIVIIIFLVLVDIGTFINNRFKNNPHSLLNSREYLPEEEIHTLKQVFYLAMMSFCFIDLLYSFITFSQYDIIYVAIFDIILSMFIAVTLIDKKSLKGKLLILLLVPYGSLNYLLFDQISLLYLIDLIHIFVLIYFIKIYYYKFREYSESNGLGIAVVLLFVLIFISFLFTQVFEGVNPLDSLVMVSNAFTSNGYAILGDSIMGKLNAIVLVWGGYILSGVGTATLTAALLTKHFNRRFDELEELIRNNNED